MVKTKVLEILNRTLQRCGERGLFQIPPDFEVQLERPKIEAHGDFATNVALNLAKPNRCSPKDIAGSLVEQLADGDGLFSLGHYFINADRIGFTLDGGRFHVFTCKIPLSLMAGIYVCQNFPRFGHIAEP